MAIKGIESSLNSPSILVEMREDGVFDRLGEASLEDSLETLTQEIAVDIFKACIGPSVDDDKQIVFDMTFCNMMFDRLEQIYRPRMRRNSTNPHVGYIYVIEKPFPMRTPEDDKNILWVGTANKPWVTIERAINGLGSAALVVLMRELKQYSRDHLYTNFVWRKEEIIDAYIEQIPQPTHAIDISMLWLPWRIVDDNFRSQATYTYYVKKYKDEGHPLRNGVAGRPGKSAKNQNEE